MNFAATSVAVLREDGRVPDGIVDAEPDEPAEHEVVVELLHQLALGAHREERLQQRGAKQPLRRDRGAAFRRVEPGEFPIERRQRLVYDLTDLAQRMSLRHPLLQVHKAEQRSRPLIRSPHLQAPS